MQVFLIVFVILTLVHPLGDFMAKRRFKGEFFIVLNPLHALYDLSPLRKHPQYSYADEKFWRWLGIDQFNHVILNLILAGIIELLI
jgi:hypothetical protein